MIPTIQFTKNAMDYIQKMIAKNKGVGFRLSIKKTGCSGYSYLPTVIDKVNEGDWQLTLENGVTIFIDVLWAHVLQDLHVDYVEEEKSGLKQKRLVFINPNEKNRCGCGESFHLDNK